MPGKEIVLIDHRRNNVVRTDFLAVVASEHPAAEPWAEVLRYGSAGFDGPVGDAACRVENVGLHERIGRAVVETTLCIKYVQDKAESRWLGVLSGDKFGYY